MSHTDPQRLRTLLRTAQTQVETALAMNTDRTRDAAMRRLLRTVLKCVYHGRTAKKLGELFAECAVEGDAGDDPVIHIYENGRTLYLRGAFDVEEIRRRIVW